MSEKFVRINKYYYKNDMVGQTAVLIEKLRSTLR